MLRHYVTWIVVAASVFIPFWGAAQPPSERNNSPTPILDRLDNLGQKIFSPFRPAEREHPSGSRAPSRSTTDEDKHTSPSSGGNHGSRAGRVAATATRSDLERPSPQQSHVSEAAAPRRDRESFSAWRDRDSLTVRPEAEPAPSEADGERAEEAATSLATGTSQHGQSRRAKDDSAISEEPSSASPPAVTGLAPIHRRLSMFRQSLVEASGDTTSQTATDDNSSTSERDSPAAIRTPLETSTRRHDKPQETLHSTQRATSKSPATEGRPTLAPTATATQDVKAQEGNEPRTLSISAQPAASDNTREDPESLQNARSSDRNRSTQTFSSSGGSTFSAESAALSIETSGPRKIVVGKEGSYEVVLRNRSVVAAEQVVVTIALPSWTEVAGADATAGAVSPVEKPDKTREIRWQLTRLGPQRSEKLSLRIVPRQSKPFGLTPKIDIAPPPSQAVIEVQEAKLVLALHGPREVVFGKPETYKLEITNDGTADAENVTLRFASNAAGEKLAAATQRLGVLPAGGKKTLTMELVARQEGTLAVSIDAQADCGAKAQLAESIAVRRAKLLAEVEGPKVAYAGNEVNYRIRVRNQGDAPANQVKIQASLPPGAKFVSALKEGRPSADGKVLWTVEQLNIGAEIVLGLKCILATDGSNRLEVRCDGDGDTRAIASAVTLVETAPKLVLTVEEPPGPVGLEGEATYQIRLENRGTAAAEAVEVVIYFAKNLEPVAAEGARHKIGSGQVVFDALPSLAPGQSTTFQVRAKADKTGNHLYRVEVHATTTGIRLVREGTTRFYSADAAVDPPMLAQPGGHEAVQAGPAARTADRRDGATGSRVETRLPR